jgi:NitT/TauT family transport system substrate-binding protein
MGAATQACADPTPIKFTLNFAVGGDAAPIYWAQDKGYFKDAGLDVTIDPSSGSGESVTRVASGVYQIGLADFSTLVEFASKHADQTPKAVLIYYRHSPQSIISWKSAGINKPADLVGRTIGTGVTDGPSRMLPALLRVAGVDISKVELKQMTPAIRDSMLMTKRVDAVVGNDYTTWFNMKARGIKLQDVNILQYANFGLDVYGNAIIVNQSLLRDNPKAVQGFVAAAMRGWREAMADPQAAAELLVARDKLIDPTIEGERLAWIRDHEVMTPDAVKYGVGAIPPGDIRKNIAVIASAFGLARTPALNSVYDARFAPARAQ